MKRGVIPAVLALAAVAALGVCLSVGTLSAKQDRDNDLLPGKGSKIPPQTLPQGFESHRELADDASPSRRTPQYSAWIIESSRFLNVPHRAFMPDVGEPPFVDLPVNVGIIKAADGSITLYDSGWKQLAYIFDWNTSCCWAPIRQQMRRSG